MVLPVELGGVCSPLSKALTPFKTKICIFCLPYLPLEQIFNSLFITVVADTVALHINYKGLSLMVLLMMKK